MSYLSLGDKDNDEDFFSSSPTGGQSSNLGSLFGLNAKMNNNVGSNQSLTYTAPRPPRPDKGTKDSGDKKVPNASGVAAAAAITAYRYVGNQYKPQGKLGMALLSNFAEKDYKILMYVSKQQPVTTAKIYPEFQFNVQANNYASFYDDQHQTWSILFADADQLSNFAKQICLAKYHCQSQEAVVVQDLVLGEADTQLIRSGDSVEVKYTGWLVQTQTGSLGSVFDSNHNSEKTFRFKTGKGKVIKGWEEGMLGMRKGGKRFLVIPPGFAYGSKGAGGRVPPNSTLSFEVDVLRLKHQSIHGSNSADSVPQTLDQRELAGSFGSALEAPFAEMPVAKEEEKEETVKGRTASYNEKISHSEAAADSTKAKLLSRMAKVGQPMLPLQHSAARADPHLVQTTTPPTPEPNPVRDQILAAVGTSHSRHPYGSGLAVHEQGAGTMPMSQPHIDYQRAAGSPHVVSHMPVQMMQNSSMSSAFQPAGIMTYSELPRPSYTPVQQFPMPSGDLLPSILMESQSSNSKLKSLIEKVDEVSEKVGRVKNSIETCNPGLNQSMEIMDANQLSFNINRIVQENERIKKQIMERDKLVQTQSNKITDLLQQNQKLLEESHDQIAKRNVSFHERFGQSQEKTLQLEQEKLHLTNKLSEATAKICEFQLNLANATEKANSLEKFVAASSGQHENEVRLQQQAKELLSAQSLLEKQRAENDKLHVLQQQSDANALEANMKLTSLQEVFEKDRERSGADYKNLKDQYESQMKLLQERLENNSSDATELKNQLEESWKEKCRETAAKVTKAAKEKMIEIESDKEQLLKNLEALQKKVHQLKGMYEGKVKSEEELKKDLMEFETTKQRYENLRKQAITMKEKYESTIEQLKEKLEEREGLSDGDVNGQIKSVMNKVFQEVRAKISPEKEYSGTDVIGIVLSVIKSTTLTLLNPIASKDGESADEENESEASDDGGTESGGEEEEVEKVKESPDSKDVDMEQPSNEDDVLNEEKVADKSGAADAVADEEAVGSNKPVVEQPQTERGKGAPLLDDLDSRAPQDDLTSDNNGVGERQDNKETKEASEDSCKPQIENQGDECSLDVSDVADESQGNGELKRLVEDPESTGNSTGIPDSVQPEQRAPSPDNDAGDKPSPPPLFGDDDDDDEDDLDWLK